MAESLKFRCPSPVSAGVSPGKPPIYDLQKEHENRLCHIITTGEYCMDTVPQLEAMMQKHIRKNLVAEVDFSAQVDAFIELISFATGVLCTGICERLEPPLKVLRGINWTLVTAVGEESAYVKEFTGFLSRATARIRPCLSTTCFLSYCMKLVSSALDRLQYNICKLRRVSRVGANQLLLDLNGIHTFMSALPNTRNKPEETPINVSKAFLSVVETRIGYLEVILKLTAAEDSKVEQMFNSIWPSGTKADYETVLAMRGKANILDPVGEHLKQGANAVGLTDVTKRHASAARGAAEDVQIVARAAAVGLKSAFSGLMSGNMFADDNTPVVSSSSANPSSTTKKKAGFF
jgi:hypothetical protein